MIGGMPMFIWVIISNKIYCTDNETVAYRCRCVLYFYEFYGMIFRVLIAFSI